MEKAPSGTPTFVRAVELRNYKSIAHCRLKLPALAFLVGPNGSGKSNFLDSLRFVSDALRESLDHALRHRGGIGEVRRRSGGHPNHFSIRIDFQLSDNADGFYRFRIGARPSGGFEVQEEECVLNPGDRLGAQARFLVKSGSVVESSLPNPPAASADRLYLVNASGFQEFRLVYDACLGMVFYSINPDCIRDLQNPDPGALLARDGRNLASVLGTLSREEPEAKNRIQEYLSKVVPGIRGIDAKSIGPKETIEFRQTVGSNRYAWKFDAASMSDGTLRALAILTALFQQRLGLKRSSLLVGVEEPEVALHPAAAGILREVLVAASKSTQVIVTSHSPDLLDDDGIDPEAIFAVASDGGATRIGPLSEFGLSALRDRLYTAGELLRMGQLEPMPAEATGYFPGMEDDRLR